MSNETERVRLRKTFSEICSSFSIYRLDNRNVYVKHFGVLDNLELDFQYDLCYKNLIKSGILTEQEKLDYLIKNGLWDAKKEQQIKDTQLVLRDLHTNKRKVYKLADIEFYSKEIEDNEKFLTKLIEEKYKLIGDTAESEAQRQSDLLLIKKSYYLNKSLTTSLYSDSDFESLSVAETNKLFDLYQQINLDLSEKNIRKIAVQRFFHDLFFLSENPTDFFGECISKLTHNQVKLLTWGTYFKNILNNSNVPTEFIDDPDAIENWYHGKQNIEQVISHQEQEGGVVSLVGVSKKELALYGLDNPANTANNQKLETKLQESINKELTVEEMIEHGFI